MRTLATAAALVALVGGCAAPSSEDAATAPATASPSASPDPVRACTRQVTYWVGETLRAAPDQGFDYQHMGLSGATYEVVRRLTDEARAALGTEADREALVARRALEECRLLEAAAPGPGNGTGWP
ncbi:hypothetical protein [Oryzobacter telluris]|uniref:hypothetical protein n=1 Tax=Oryzobacter telluris TaxID=3149179 RepID=UPI00370D26A3